MPRLEAHFSPVLPRWAFDARVAMGYLRLADTGLEKLCCACREWLPADTEFFGLKPDRVDQLKTRCRCCIAEGMPGLAPRLLPRQWQRAG